MSTVVDAVSAQADEAPAGASLNVKPSRDERARQRFVSGVRSYVLHSLADGMRQVYEQRVEPEFVRAKERPPADGVEVHRALKQETLFKFYSRMRCEAQEMVWRSVMPAVERGATQLADAARSLAAKPVGGSLRLDPDFHVPATVSDIDIHLMPGSYCRQRQPGDVTAAAIYDNGAAVFSMGLLGSERDDIGASISQFIRWRYPQFEPRRILDIGCGIGNNTLPWARRYPEAEVHGLDAAEPLLRYGHARAQARGVPLHFHQGSTDALPFEDASFDLLFSSMVLHELPEKAVRSTFAEAFRVLKPGGLMLHMELPPNRGMAPYDSFYLDWDSYYNKEPFYKAFRDMVPERVCQEAGFAPENFVSFVIPSLSLQGEDAIREAVGQKGVAVDSDTGRLSDKIQWFVFGAWK